MVAKMVAISNDVYSYDCCVTLFFFATFPHGSVEEFVEDFQFPLHLVSSSAFIHAVFK